MAMMEGGGSLYTYGTRICDEPSGQRSISFENGRYTKPGSPQFLQFSDAAREASQVIALSVLHEDIANWFYKPMLRKTM